MEILKVVISLIVCFIILVIVIALLYQGGMHASDRPPMKRHKYNRFR